MSSQGSRATDSANLARGLDQPVRQQLVVPIAKVPGGLGAIAATMDLRLVISQSQVGASLAVRRIAFIRRKGKANVEAN